MTFYSFLNMLEKDMGRKKLAKERKFRHNIMLTMRVQYIKPLIQLINQFHAQGTISSVMCSTFSLHYSFSLNIFFPHFHSTQFTEAME